MKDTVHCYCPSCRRPTPQAVFRERLLAAVHWCQHCYQVTIRPEDASAEVFEPRANAA